MRPVPERHMTSCLFAGYVELARPVECRLISVSRCGADCYLSFRGQFLPSQYRIPGRLPQENMRGGAETGDLLDGVRDQVRPLAQQSPLLWMLEQLNYAGAHQGGRGDVAGQ